MDGGSLPNDAQLGLGQAGIPVESQLPALLPIATELAQWGIVDSSWNPLPAYTALAQMPK